MVMTFIDDNTQVLLGLSNEVKLEASTVFKTFHKSILNVFHTPIHLYANNGRDYFSHDLTEYLNSNDIIHQSTCAHTSQHNGIAKRKTCDLLEVVRSIIFF